MGYYNTFVVKIWCDTCGQTTRGHVRHVGSQALVHFRDMAGLSDFVLAHLEPPSAEPVASESLPGHTNPASIKSGELAEDG